MQNKIKNLIMQYSINSLFCCSKFHSHCRVFKNGHNSNTKMSVKRLLAIIDSINAFVSSWSDLVYRRSLPNYVFSNKNIKYGWSNLTNTVIIVSYITLLGYNYRLQTTIKNPPTNTKHI